MTWIPSEELRALLDNPSHGHASPRLSNSRTPVSVSKMSRPRRACSAAWSPTAASRPQVPASSCSPRRLQPRSLAALTSAYALSRESVQWVRVTLIAQIENSGDGLGGRIDALRTTGGLTGNAARLERYRLEAKRDVDIALSHVAFGLPKVTSRPRRPVYRLLVSGAEHAWNGSPVTFERHRVFGPPTQTSKRASTSRSRRSDGPSRAACVFAYEETVGKAPLFGRLTHILSAGHGVKIDYEVVPVEPFLSAADWASAGAELAIGDRFERFRTHWALKEVNLHQVLGTRGIALPGGARCPPIDIEAHHFDVALSFPGEKRDLVAPIAQHLEQVLGPNSVFHDAFYQGELAQPDLDTLLQDIYGGRSTLVVVVAGADYQRKTWCGLEFRAIKQRIWAKEHRKVMIVRTDDGAVDGIFETDGFLDARQFDTRDLAAMIAGRVRAPSQTALA